MNVRRDGPLWTPLLVAAIIAFLSACTNALDIDRFSWDFRYYIAMARDGLDAGGLVAPFAYRFLWTSLVGGTSALLRVPIGTAFAIVTLLALFAQLVLLDRLLLRWGRPAGAARWAVAWTALAYADAKFLLFDVYRPEPVAFALMVVAIGALAEGRVLACVLVAMVGLQVREFFAIPLVLAAVFEVWPRLGPHPERPARPARAGFIVAGLLLAIALPRALLPVTHSFQTLDVQHDVRAWRGLVGIPLLLARDLNLLYSILAYTLPVLLLLTRDRLVAVRTGIGRYGGLLLGYTGLTLVLALYGGTDLFRFVAYLFLPQAFVLALLAERATLAEKVYVLVALTVFNRAFLPVPQADVGSLLDFYGGWGDRVNVTTAARALEAGAWLLGAVALRAWIARIRPGATVKVSPGH